MVAQVNNGRSFEWSVGLSIKELTNGTIIESDSSLLAKSSFEKISDSKKKSFINSARVAVEHILAKEKIEQSKENLIKFNSDKAGEVADVRDVILELANKKTIGFSCKNNHEALKHSRLSDKIDFIKKWGIDSHGCSQDYWQVIHQLFGELRDIQQNSNKTALWKSLPNKSDKYYWPILDAWAKELEIIKSQSPEAEEKLCIALMSYLVGKDDFYKIMRQGKNIVNVQGWNFKNTLATKKTKYPNVIVAINNKNGGQYSKTIVFNHGYSLNFRIHSASSRVEPSLKFDINAIGLPPSEIYQVTLDVPSK